MALTSLLVNQGIEVLILTRAASERNKRIINHPNVHIMVCDYEHLENIRNNTNKKWDCFFHFAWAGASGPGRNDMLLQNNNVRIALASVSMAKEFGCTKFIGAGSQAEYGKHSEKLRPDTPVFPNTGYGYAKLCAGLMTRDYSNQLNMEHNWLRILSVFGPYDGCNSMLAQTIRSLKKGVSPDFTKGEQIWDYVYSKDAAKAFLYTAERGLNGKCYVLGSGEERKLADYLLCVRDIIAPEVTLKLGALPYTDNQIMYLAGDSSELIQDTHYYPDYTFAMGIKNMIEEDLLI